MEQLDEDFLKWPIDFKAIKMLSSKVVRAYTIFPIRLNEPSLIIAATKQLSTDTVKELEFVLEKKISLILLTKAETLQSAIDYYYGKETAHAQLLLHEPKPEFEDSIHTYVHRILQSAIEKKASDIHWEIFSNKLKIRFRIDGVLVELESPSKNIARSLINYIKILSKLDIDETHLPQDGSYVYTQSKGTYYFRVSSIPSVYGESLVMRLFNDTQNLIKIEALGMSQATLNAWTTLLNAPEGLLLVGGPTGSGKSTTLYASLNYKKNTAQKIITIEDPIEQELEGINQIAIKNSIERDFASTFKSALRQSPDVIMVGEIRDNETAQIALNAGLSGHLVISSIHANNVEGVINRLRSLNINPAVLQSCLKGILIQRLIRTICQKCTPLNLNEKPSCPNCLGTQMKGRTGIFEVFSSRPTFSTPKNNTYSSIYEDGVAKVNAGLTTLDEVLSCLI